MFAWLDLETPELTAHEIAEYAAVNEHAAGKASLSARWLDPSHRDRGATVARRVTRARFETVRTNDQET